MATLNPQQLATANILGQPVNQQPMGLDRINTTNAAVPSPMATQATTPTPFTATAVGQPVPQQTAQSTAAQPFATSTMGNQQMGMYTNTGDAASVPLGYLDQILNQENALLRNARTSGLELAASRGLQNSSIAAGAAQRAALDYAMPVLGMAQDTFNQREHRAWQGGEAALDRQFTREEREAVQQWQSDESQLTRDQQITMANLQEEMARAQREWTAQQNQLDRDQQLTMAEVQNWLANEAFTREFNAQLAAMPINNTSNLLNFIAQQAITNPEIFTPDIVSGMSEFFATNAMDVLSRYFPNYFQNEGGA